MELKPFQVVHAYLFFSIRFAGGTCDLIYKICKYQARTRLRPIVLTGSYEFDEKLASSLKDTEFIKVPSFLDRFGFSLMPSLWAILKYRLPEVGIVHMHAFRTIQNVLLYFACRRANIPYVIDAHGSAIYGKKKVWLKRFFDLVVGRRMLKDAGRLIAETEVGIREYTDLGVDSNKVDIVSPPFDTEEFDDLPGRGEFRSRYDLGERRIILFLGRLHYIKGIDFLIDGFARYHERDPEAILVIVGSDDGHEAELRDQSERMGLTDSVHFTGFLSGWEKTCALVDADIVAQTSRFEQGAWAPFEAVLCGTPIVVTADTGAGEDVRRLDAGTTVPFGDTKALADAFSSIFDAYPAASERTMRAAHFLRSRMSMTARVHEYEDIYKKCHRTPLSGPSDLH